MMPDSNPVLPKIIHLLPVAAMAGHVAHIVTELAQAQKLDQNRDVEIWCLHSDDVPNLLPDNVLTQLPIDHFTMTDSWGTFGTALQVALDACPAQTIFHWHAPTLNLDTALLAFYLKRQKYNICVSLYDTKQPNFLSCLWWRLLRVKQHKVFENAGAYSAQNVFIPCLIAPSKMPNLDTWQSPALYKPQTPILLCPIVNEPWLKQVLLPALQHYWQQAGPGAQGALWFYDTTENKQLANWQKFLHRYNLQQRVRIWPQPVSLQNLAGLVMQADMVIVPQTTMATTNLLHVLAHTQKKLALPAQSWLAQQWSNTSCIVADNAWLEFLPKVAQAVQTNQQLFLIDDAQHDLQQWQTPQHYAAQISELLYHAT